MIPRIYSIDKCRAINHGGVEPNQCLMTASRVNKLFYTVPSRLGITGLSSILQTVRSRTTKIKKITHPGLFYRKMRCAKHTALPGNETNIRSSQKLYAGTREVTITFGSRIRDCRRVFIRKMRCSSANLNIPLALQHQKDETFLSS